ncbi:hypothetical protein [Xylanimonas ulmi]|uniref:Uncharacterized protein n=1 Tax=Xylanimonas ulmi TaxID=228973 RepID=A0A4Q7M441_9MICO|nr:hypothetical protein [Xylanibacterium ulmi]RZS61667.1 hypothetical protein EV386_1977 [Xylanibacterium ulmi]
MSQVAKAWCSCGWHGEYDTPARADFARRQHSCALWEAKRASARRGFERRRAVDRTPKECRHKVADHQHGTYAMYTLDGCRCRPCAAAASTYNISLKRNNAYGRSAYVDAELVRAHVRALAAANIGLKTIAARSGVSHGSLWKLMYGRTRPDGSRTPSARVTKANADAILAVRPTLDTNAPASTVPAIGAMRRVQALAAQGWSIPTVCAHAGVDRQAVDRILRDPDKAVHAETARRIRGAYDALWDQAPPESNQRERIAASRARNRARREGWAPPLAWDDDTIDLPDATANLGAAAPVKGGVAADDRLDDWTHLVRAGEDPERAARRAGYCGTKPLGSVERAAYRLGRTDVLTVLYPATHRQGAAA